MDIGKKYNLLVILGPTASGKTKFAADIAYKLNGEIISADSRQVYKYMDLGTGKDYGDYLVNGKKIPYHLIDMFEPGFKYNVFEYQKDFFNVFNKISADNKIPILCGGTGMYIDAVTKGYKLISVPVDPRLREKLSGKTLTELEDILRTYKQLHNKTDTGTIKRALRAIEIEEYYLTNEPDDAELPEIKPLFIGVEIDRETRRQRITDRLRTRLEQGMVEEVRQLIGRGVSTDDLIYYGLEYKFITIYILGEISYDEMIRRLNIAIHQFAKRQMTWFRKMEREGVNIHWIDGRLQKEEFSKNVIRLLNK